MHDNSVDHQTSRSVECLNFLPGDATSQWSGEDLDIGATWWFRGPFLLLVNHVLISQRC